MTTRNARSSEGPIKRDLGRQSDRLLRYLGSRTMDQWFMFAAGIIIGLVLG